MKSGDNWSQEVIGPCINFQLKKIEIAPLIYLPVLPDTQKRSVRRRKILQLTSKAGVKAAVFVTHDNICHTFEACATVLSVSEFRIY